MDSHNCYTSVTKFSIGLYQELAKITDEDIIFSPNGVFFTLSMVIAGAGGDTLQQLLSTLGFSNESELSAYILGFREEAADIPGVGMSLARKLYTNTNLRTIFLNKVQEVIDGKVRKSGMMENSEGMRRRINLWLSRHTRQENREPLDGGAVSTNPCVVGVNANFFNCVWHQKFPRDLTEKANFKNYLGAISIVEMMKTVGTFRINYFKPLKSTAVEIRYNNDNLAMWVVLPDLRVQMDFVEEELSCENIETMIWSSEQKHVSVSLPKFRKRFGKDLSPAIQALGVKDAFSKDRANLSRMSYQTRVVLSNVVQESVVEVDECGTWAIPPTGADKDNTLSNLNLAAVDIEHFVCDRPFMFFIHHKTLQQILFMGKVTDF